MTFENPLAGTSIRLMKPEKLNKYQGILRVTKKDHHKKYKLHDAETKLPPRAPHLLNLMRKAFKIARHCENKKLTLFDKAQGPNLVELINGDKEFKAYFDCFRLLSSQYEDMHFGRNDFLADAAPLKKPYKPFGLEKGQSITPLRFAEGIVQYGDEMKKDKEENADLVIALGQYCCHRLSQRPLVIDLLLNKQLATKDTRYKSRDMDPLEAYELLTGKERKPGGNFPTLKAGS